MSVNFESTRIADILDSTGETDRRLIRHVICRMGLTEIVDISSTKFWLRNLTQISTTTALTTGSANFFGRDGREDRERHFDEANDRRRSWHTAMHDDQGEAREYRCGEDGFYLYRDDRLCYDDEGFSYRFGEDDSFEPGTSRVVSARKSPPRKRVNVVNLTDTEPEDIRRPWRPHASISSRPEEGEVVEAAESTDDTIPTPLVESLILPGSSVAQPLAVSKVISDEISGWMTKGISIEASKAISKKFPVEYGDTEFLIKPPKLDGWIGRRAQLRLDKGLL